MSIMLRSRKKVLFYHPAVLCLVAQLCPILCDPMDCSPPGLSVCGDSPGKNTGVGCHVLLQRIFPNQGSNPSLPHCRQILYHRSHQGSPFTTLNELYLYHKFPVGYFSHPNERPNTNIVDTEAWKYTSHSLDQCFSNLHQNHLQGWWLGSHLQSLRFSRCAVGPENLHF